jgi:hypothetical protein
MIFMSIDEETRTATEISEPQTIALISRMVATAIGRWVLSGVQCPDCDATDGISAEESAMMEY